MRFIHRLNHATCPLSPAFQITMAAYLGYFFPGDCYKTVIEDFAVPDGNSDGIQLDFIFSNTPLIVPLIVTCMKLAIGRCLSLGIILGSLLGKLDRY